MYTTQMEFLRRAGMTVTGKRALKRNFALKQISHLHFPGIAICRYKDKRLEVHTTPIEELWNY